MNTLHVYQTIHYTFEVPDDFPRTNEAADEYFCDMEDPEALAASSHVEHREVSMGDAEGKEIVLSSTADEAELARQLVAWEKLSAESAAQDQRLAKDWDPMESLWAPMAASPLISGAVSGLVWDDLVPEQKEDFAKLIARLHGAFIGTTREMFSGPAGTAANDWVAHLPGDKMPVAAETRVYVRLSDGTEWDRALCAGSLYWGMYSYYHGTEIVAYKVIYEV